MICAALEGRLEGIPTQSLTPFDLEVPRTCPGIPPQLLDPRGTWSDPDAYDLRARELGEDFIRNFSQFETQVVPEVQAAGPNLNS
jgi:phosphoenolpyruvate carboxykinase (ATP)